VIDHGAYNDVATAEIEFQDELLGDPSFAAALEDSEARHRLRVDLVAQRKAARLTQAHVADHMQTTQSFVSEFETGCTDPRLSTFQRYARAVAAKLVVRIELPAECGWQPAWDSSTWVAAEGPSHSWPAIAEIAGSARSTPFPAWCEQVRR
jgi:transcriptional regulator with XRE-family HTH domain